MDPSTLVEGGSTGLDVVAEAFRSEGFPVEAIYLIRRRSLEDEETYWALVLVVSPFQPNDEANAIGCYSMLHQAGRLPEIESGVRFELVPPDHIEASRLLAYVRRRGSPPIVLRNVGTQGLLIDYAMVAEDRGNRARAA